MIAIHQSERKRETTKDGKTVTWMSLQNGEQWQRKWDRQ